MSRNPRISFERILCATDLTPDSDEALRYAIAFSRAFNSKLFVLNCREASLNGGESGHRQTRRSIERAVACHLKQGGLSKLDWTPLVTAGDPAECINRQAAERRVDLVVMRSRRRPYAAALLGSTAEAVCRTAPCPVLVTHRQEREWVGRSSNEIDLRRVLVASDFSNESELALSYGLSLAEEYQAEMHMMSVIEPQHRPEAPELALLPVSVESSLNTVVRQLHEAIPSEVHLWCSVKYVVREGHPYREVLTYADETEIDLICMGAHGEGFGMRALFGSNADRVLRQAPCPVLIARPLKPAVYDGIESTNQVRAKNNNDEVGYEDTACSRRV